MPKNEAAWDRVIRIVIGLVALSLTVVGPKSMLGLVGLVPLLTGAVGYCPLYALLGIGTCTVGR